MIVDCGNDLGGWGGREVSGCGGLVLRQFVVACLRIFRMRMLAHSGKEVCSGVGSLFSRFCSYSGKIKCLLLWKMVDEGEAGNWEK